MEGIESRESLIGIFSCSDYGGCGNMGSSLEVGKSLQLKPMILEPVSSRGRWLEGIDRKKPINQEDALLRARALTPPKRA